MGFRESFSLFFFNLCVLLAQRTEVFDRFNTLLTKQPVLEAAMAKTDLNVSDCPSELFSAYLSHRNTLRAVCLALHQAHSHSLFDSYRRSNSQVIGSLLALLANQLEGSLAPLSRQLLNRGAPPLAVGSDLAIDATRVS